MAVKGFHSELGAFIAEIGAAKAASDARRRADAVQAEKAASAKRRSKQGVGALGGALLGAVKKAEPLSEAGSIDGETTHPVGDADDGLIKLEEGAHSAENSDAVQEQIPNSVDEAEEGVSVPQEERQLDVGIKNSPVGGDPASETESVNATRDDPGTTHPANVDESPKYASWKLSDLQKAASSKANDILADMSVLLGIDPARRQGPGTAKAAGDVPAAFQTKNQGKKTPMPVTGKAVEGKPVDQGHPDPATIKRALDEAIAGQSQQIILNALAAAEEAGQFITQYGRGLRKQAVEGNPAGAAVPPEEAMPQGGDPSGAAPPGDPSAGGGNIPPEMLQAMMAQGDQGGQPPGGDSGAGSDGGEHAMGGDPAAGGGGGEDEAVDQLVQALEEKGISPEELLAAIQGSMPADGQGDPGAGGMPPGAGPAPPEAGGMPPEAGGAPPGAGGDEPPPDMPPEKAAQYRKAARTMRVDLVKLARAAVVHKHTGRFHYRGAKNASEAQLRDEIKRCVSDMLGR